MTRVSARKPQHTCACACVRSRCALACDVRETSALEPLELLLLCGSVRETQRRLRQFCYYSRALRNAYAKLVRASVRPSFSSALHTTTVGVANAVHKHPVCCYRVYAFVRACVLFACFRAVCFLRVCAFVHSYTIHELAASAAARLPASRAEHQTQLTTTNTRTGDDATISTRTTSSRFSHGRVLLDSI